MYTMTTDSATGQAIYSPRYPASEDPSEKKLNSKQSEATQSSQIQSSLGGLKAPSPLNMTGD